MAFFDLGFDLAQAGRAIPSLAGNPRHRCASNRSNCRTEEVNLHLAQRIGTLCLSGVLLWGVPYQFNSAFASGVEQEQKGDSPALTIYNQQFAVVRQKLPLDLPSGVNHLQVTDITAHLEPDSVILRSLDTGRRLQILEQNYRNDPVSQQLLLSLYEGKTIDFVETDKDGNARTVQVKSSAADMCPITPRSNRTAHNMPHSRLRLPRAASNPSLKSTASCNSPCRVSPSSLRWPTIPCSSPRSLGSC